MQLHSSIIIIALQISFGVVIISLTKIISNIGLRNAHIAPSLSDIQHLNEQ